MKAEKQVVIALLRYGYAQKTVARKTGWRHRDVSKLAVAEQVGRRLGQTREQVRAQTMAEAAQERLLEA